MNVTIGCNEEILSLIAEYSYILSTLQLKFDNKLTIECKTWIKFAEKCGQNLQYIRIGKYNEENFNTGMFHNTYCVTTIL